MRYTSAVVMLVEQLCAGDKVEIARTWEKVRKVTKSVPGIDSTRGEEVMGEFANVDEETEVQKKTRLKLAGMMEEGGELWQKAEAVLEKDPRAALSYLVNAKELTAGFIAMLPKDGWESAKENAEAILAEADKQIDLIQKRLS